MNPYPSIIIFGLVFFICSTGSTLIKAQITDPVDTMNFHQSTQKFSGYYVELLRNNGNWLLQGEYLINSDSIEYYISNPHLIPEAKNIFRLVDCSGYYNHRLDLSKIEGICLDNPAKLYRSADCNPYIVCQNGKDESYAFYIKEVEVSIQKYDGVIENFSDSAHLTFRDTVYILEKIWNQQRVASLAEIGLTEVNIRESIEKWHPAFNRRSRIVIPKKNRRKYLKLLDQQPEYYIGNFEFSH